MTHLILGELEMEHKAQKAPGATAETAKPADADADELREKFRIVRVSPLRRCSHPGTVFHFGPEEDSHSLH